MYVLNFWSCFVFVLIRYFFVRDVERLKLYVYFIIFFWDWLCLGLFEVLWLWGWLFEILDCVYLKCIDFIYCWDGVCVFKEEFVWIVVFGDDNLWLGWWVYIVCYRFWVRCIKFLVICRKENFMIDLGRWVCFSVYFFLLFFCVYFCFKLRKDWFEVVWIYFVF